jgi:hypothetical protein
MVDTREDILARLLEVVTGIPGMRSAQRNNIDIPEDQLPAVVVLDGDEETTGNTQNRASNSPVYVQMTPGIVVQVQDDNAVIGSVITSFRRELIKRVLFDSELNALSAKSSPRGEATIRYLGCQTDVGWTRTGYAALTAQLMFKYVLKPDEL